MSISNYVNNIWIRGGGVNYTYKTKKCNYIKIVYNPRLDKG
jgi:hypothetical protein